MPIYHFGNKLIYFCHIPKAGGTTIASYLSSLGGTQHMFSTTAHSEPRRSRLVNLPPQHITAMQFEQIFEARAFDANFTFTRHPEDRLISEYLFRHPKGGIHAALPFSDWVEFIISAYRLYPFALDGHIIRQIDFIGADTKVFKLETGLDEFQNWISGIIDQPIDANVAIQHEHASAKQPIKLTAQCRRLINDFYREDFQKLGYAARAPEDLPNDSMHAVRAPILRTLGAAYAFARRGR